MLRSQGTQQRQADRKAGLRHQPLLVFSVGGRRLAARTQDVAGVQAWQPAMPVPSDTPFVGAMIRLGQESMPVFDLAGKLNRTLEAGQLLCLVIRHEDGPMAICIDAYIPSLQTIDPSTIHSHDQDDSDIAGLCSVGSEQVTIINCARLGKGANSVLARLSV